MMPNIIIVSEMRVGSRWLHYLLADVLNMKPSPEIDGKRLGSCDKEVSNYFKEKRIAKFHHATPSDIFNKLFALAGARTVRRQKKTLYKLIGIVRNPRDRIVSVAFHHKYNKRNYELKKVKNDRDAVNEAFWNDTLYLEPTMRQFKLMREGESTRGCLGGRYIWTSYEWMLEDPVREVKKILTFLGVARGEGVIKACVEKNSFKSKSGRKRGNEKRDDTWRRKGVNDDWKNWFDKYMTAASAHHQTDYEQRIWEEEEWQT